MSLIRRLVHGDWNEADFLTVPIGSSVKAVYDGSIVACKQDFLPAQKQDTIPKKESADE